MTYVDTDEVSNAEGVGIDERSKTRCVIAVRGNCSIMVLACFHNGMVEVVLTFDVVRS